MLLRKAHRQLIHQRLKPSHIANTTVNPGHALQHLQTVPQFPLPRDVVRTSGKPQLQAQPVTPDWLWSWRRATGGQNARHGQINLFKFPSSCRPSPFHLHIPPLPPRVRIPNAGRSSSRTRDTTSRPSQYSLHKRRLGLPTMSLV